MSTETSTTTTSNHDTHVNTHSTRERATKKATMLDTFHQVKSTLEDLADDKKVLEYKKQLKSLMQKKGKAVSSMINKEIALAKKKLTTEKNLLEKEFKKQSLQAQKFIDAQKKELKGLQTKFEKMVLGASPKKSTKKVAKKVKKTAKSKK
jgi:hypothetical protein